MAKSPARGAESGSPRAHRGTSATPTKTVRSTRAPSTKSATAARRPTGRSAKGANSQPGGPSEAELAAAIAGGRVISVFGMFDAKALIEVPTAVAQKVFPPEAFGRSLAGAVSAVESDLAVIRERAPQLADSALGASALAMAYELENPYNSATSKSMCAKALLDLVNRLRELSPPEEKRDGLDDLASRRSRRLAGRSASAH